MDEIIDFATAEFVKDPETGEVLAVEHTQEYGQLVRDFWERECKHSETDPMKVRIANGATQVRNCCTACGERVGTAVSQKDKAWVDGLPWQSSELSDTYSGRRATEKRDLLLSLAKRQYAERGRFTKSYTEYLQSDAWKAKRALVLKRCGGICEGCGVSKAREVHHLHYAHLFDEFLFELVGLCHTCHDKLTQEKRSSQSEPEVDGCAAAIADCF